MRELSGGGGETNLTLEFHIEIQITFIRLNTRLTEILFEGTVDIG